MSDDSVVAQPRTSICLGYHLLGSIRCTHRLQCAFKGCTAFDFAPATKPSGITPSSTDGEDGGTT